MIWAYFLLIHPLKCNLVPSYRLQIIHITFRNKLLTVKLFKKPILSRTPKARDIISSHATYFWCTLLTRTFKIDVSVQFSARYHMWESIVPQFCYREQLEWFFHRARDIITSRAPYELSFNFCISCNFQVSAQTNILPERRSFAEQLFVKIKPKKIHFKTFNRP